MTPISEDDLRLVLGDVDPLDGEFTAPALAAGRRRRLATRAVLGVVAAGVVVLATAAALTLSPVDRAVPAGPTPTVSATAPGPTPAPTKAPSTVSRARAIELPATLGEVLVSLPHEGVKADNSDATDWRPSAITIAPCNLDLVAPSLAKLAGAKSVMMTAPELVRWETFLVFESEDAAATFMGELAFEIGERCDKAPALDPQFRSRTGQARFPMEGATTALRYGQWQEFKTETGWADAVGTGQGLFAARGRVVVGSGLGGEGVGSPLKQPAQEWRDVVVAVQRMLKEPCIDQSSCTK